MFGTVGFWVSLLIVLLLVVWVQAIAAGRPQVDGTRLTYARFVDLAEDGRIESAKILDWDAYVVGTYRRRDLEVVPFNVPYLKMHDGRGQLLDVLLENDIAAEIDQQYGKQAMNIVMLAIPAFLLVVVVGYLYLSARRGTGLFAVRSGAQRAGAEQMETRFSDTAAQDAAVTELRELAQFLSDPKKFTALGARIPSGILLYGPPGCGKTLLAKALAGESGAAFYSISGSDFVELYVGVGAARVRDLFKEARENAPSIVFIDEIDAIGRRRKTMSSDGPGEEQSQALNQILTEMDGFSDERLGTIVVGATNRPDDLDPALLRPGRFDRALPIDRPNEEGRLAILEVHARGKPLAEEADLAKIAHRAVGMTGADLASVMNEAALLTARAGREEITQEELDAALTRIVEAPERQRRLSVRDRSLGQRSLAEERVTFADVAGIEEALDELNEVKHFLSDPDSYVSLGARFPRGFLLIGAPGTGKTLLARAVAGESNAAFLTVAATEFTEVYVGEGAGRVRDLFSEARSVAPAIVFIDEIDAIGTRRGASLDGGSRETDQTLNQILIELDGFGQRAGVVVVAATNRPDMLDPALLRPGRFDRQVTIDLPDRDGRRAVLQVHAKGKRLAPDVNLDRVAGLTRGLSGADLANVLNEAALLAARRGAPEIDMGLVEEGIDRALGGVAGGRVMSEEERRVVAYHEAGHALVARALPAGRILHKLSIVPRGHRLGYTWVPESDERLTHSRSDLVDQMATGLGGRAAEEMVFGETWDGASSDLARVGEIARRMVCELGMSKAVGALPASADGHARSPGFSDETARLVDAEVRRLVEEAEELARAALRASRQALDRVADALVERETLTMEDVEEIAGAPPTVARPNGAPRRELTGTR